MANSKWLLPLLLLLVIEIDLYDCQSSSNPAKPAEIGDALRKTMAYYNCSLNLDEKLEMLLKIYDSETNDDLQSAKQKILPPDYKSLEGELKGLESDYHNEYVSTTEIIAQVRDIDSRYEKFQKLVRRTDAIFGNLRTIERMHTDAKSANEDFEHYAIIQNQFFDVWRLLNDSGIKLIGPGEAQLEVRVVDKEKYKEFLTRYKKSDDFVEHSSWGIFRKTGVVERTAPSSDELTVLERLINLNEKSSIYSQEVEILVENNKEMLSNFIPMLNKRVLQIITKMKLLKQRVNTLDKESKDYGNYIWDFKDAVGQRIKALKNIVDIANKDEL